MSAVALWDYIQKHELFRRGLVNVGDVCERLNKLARYDGIKPVFQEKDVESLIKQCTVSEDTWDYI